MHNDDNDGWRTNCIYNDLLLSGWNNAFYNNNRKHNNRNMQIADLVNWATNVLRCLFLFLFSIFSISCAKDDAITEEKYSEIYRACKQDEPGAFFHPKSNALCLNGLINEELEKKAIEILDERTPNYLVLESEGGFLRAAINIGNKIHDRELTAIVGGVCASSCSQFIWIAASKKVVLKGGAVVFHGGPIADETIKNMDIPESHKINLLEEQEIFRKYYDKLGLDMTMLTKPPSDIQALLDKGQIVFWGWPQDKLEEFGVIGIEIYQQ